MKIAILALAVLLPSLCVSCRTAIPVDPHTGELAYHCLPGTTTTEVVEIHHTK